MKIVYLLAGGVLGDEAAQGTWLFETRGLAHQAVENSFQGGQVEIKPDGEFDGISVVTGGKESHRYHLRPESINKLPRL